MNGLDLCIWQMKGRTHHGTTTAASILYSAIAVKKAAIHHNAFGADKYGSATVRNILRESAFEEGRSANAGATYVHCSATHLAGHCLSQTI